LLDLSAVRDYRLMLWALNRVNLTKLVMIPAESVITCRERRLISKLDQRVYGTTEPGETRIVKNGTGGRHG